MVVDPLLQAQLSGEFGRQNMKKTKAKTAVLPEFLQKDVNTFVDYLVSLEKKYYDNPLNSFDNHEKEMRLKAREYFSEEYSLIQLGQKALQERFEKQDKAHEQFPPESSFTKWQEAILFGGDEIIVDKTKALQAQLGISWAFMDRAYGVARSLYAERKFEESLAVFHFLRFLNPEVFEYWFGEACLLQELGKPEEAADMYSMSLVLQPNNPLVYFQIANCYSALGDKDSALQALEFCIDYAHTSDAHTHLLERAEQIKQTLLS